MKRGSYEPFRQLSFEQKPIDGKMGFHREKVCESKIFEKPTRMSIDCHNTSVTFRLKCMKKTKKTITNFQNGSSSETAFFWCVQVKISFTYIHNMRKGERVQRNEIWFVYVSNGERVSNPSMKECIFSTDDTQFVHVSMWVIITLQSWHYCDFYKATFSK